MDVTVVNPCADEVAKLKAGGLSIATVDPKNAFSKPVGVQQIQGVPILFAYNARADLPEDVVYKMLVAFEKNKERLASTDAGFAPLAKDFVKLQVDGINANLPGYKLVITGGSDKAGFPMRADFEGAARRRLLLPEGVGFHPKDYPGKRKRMSVRGNRVSNEIIQVNLKVAKAGSKPVADHFATLAPAEKKA